MFNGEWNKDFLKMLFEPNDVYVVDLRLANGEWNKDFLEMLFEPNDVLRILSFHVGSLENDDELILNHYMDGHYSVRSGYREALAAKDLVEALDPKESKAS